VNTSAWSTTSGSRTGANVSMNNAPPSQQQQRGSQVQQTTATSTKNDFGGKSMNVQFREWCQAEMNKLGADMALAEFCFTIDSASDIREYMRDYLGSTPQVSSFATEFIQRKGMARNVNGKSNPVNQGGFTSVPGSKKNRKKKDRGF